SATDSFLPKALSGATATMRRASIDCRSYQIRLTGPLNDRPLVARDPHRRLEFRNRERRHERRTVDPERPERALPAGLIEVAQVGGVTRREVRDPLIEVVDIDLVEQLERVPARLELVRGDLGELCFRPVIDFLERYFPPARTDIPLHGVPEQVDEDEH